VSTASSGARVVMRVQLLPAKRKPGVSPRVIAQGTAVAKRSGPLVLTLRISKASVPALRRAPVSSTLSITATGTGQGLKPVTRRMKTKLRR
jgi:hypothetical protein